MQIRPIITGSGDTTTSIILHQYLMATTYNVNDDLFTALYTITLTPSQLVRPDMQAKSLKLVFDAKLSAGDATTAYICVQVNGVRLFPDITEDVIDTTGRTYTYDTGIINPNAVNTLEIMGACADGQTAQIVLDDRVVYGNFLVL